MKKRRLFRMIVPAYPAFNIYTNVAAKTTALGPVCVASAANKLPGWDVEVIDENNLGRFGPRDERGADHEAIQKVRPADVIGFYGGLTSTAERIYQLADFYKKQGAVTIGGGQHFMGDNIAEALRSNIDYVVLGEGEPIIRELLQMLQNHQEPAKVNGLAYIKDDQITFTPQREKISDFDSLELPDFSLVRYARIKIYPVEWVRGCGMNCEFCTVKGKPRPASIDRIMEQIRRAIEIHNTRQFFVVDDLFGQFRNETLQLCDMLSDYQQKMNIRLFITVQIRLDKAKDEQLLSAMRSAGIRCVAIGFESPVNAELAAMHKNIRAADMLSYVQTFRKHGFLVHGMFIFGYPTSEHIAAPLDAQRRRKAFKKFIRRAKIDTVQVLLPVPLPGTELRKRLKDADRLYKLSDIGWQYYDGNFPLFEPDEPMTAEQMQQAARKIMADFYRFRSMLFAGLSLISFPAVVLASRRLQSGWHRWYRTWRNNVVRFGGWIVLRRWTAKFEQGDFLQRLSQTRANLKTNDKTNIPT